MRPISGPERRGPNEPKCLFLWRWLLQRSHRQAYVNLINEAWFWRKEPAAYDSIRREVSRQSGWTHFTLLLPIKDSLCREFYAEMCRIERWNTRTLHKKIQSEVVLHVLGVTRFAQHRQSTSRREPESVEPATCQQGDYRRAKLRPV